MEGKQSYRRSILTKPLFVPDSKCLKLQPHEVEIILIIILW